MSRCGVFSTGVRQADNQFNRHVFCPECVHNWRVVYWLRPRLTKNCVSNADNVIIA
ncbi:Uncharacterised protein [Shigella sonnei]|nr:Uncharacterised protein [Shigella sonnei]CST24009.1 Uncharacterised protein [Shigella sonnei]